MVASKQIFKYPERKGTLGSVGGKDKVTTACEKLCKAKWNRTPNPPGTEALEKL